MLHGRPNCLVDLCSVKPRKLGGLGQLKETESDRVRSAGSRRNAVTMALPFASQNLIRTRLCIGIFLHSPQIIAAIVNAKPIPRPTSRPALLSSATVWPWHEYSPLSTPNFRSSFSLLQLSGCDEVTLNFLSTRGLLALSVPRSMNG